MEPHISDDKLLSPTIASQNKNKQREQSSQLQEIEAVLCSQREKLASFEDVLNQMNDLLPAGFRE